MPQSLMRAYGPTLLRLCLGTLLVVYGVEQLFGVRGGGLAYASGIIGAFGGKPVHPLAIAAAVGELLAGGLLLAGAFTTIVALLLVVVRSAALYQSFIVTHAYAAADRTVRTEFELSLLLIGALLALAIMGPGARSFDERKVRTAERAAAGRARLRSR